MPELPEVATIVADLAPLLPGVTITKASYIGNLGRELLAKSSRDLSINLPGKKITSVERLAKQVIIGLDSGENLALHLKITGRLLFRELAAKDDEYTRLLIDLGNGQQLRFTDRNGFADANLLESRELDQIESRYGPEVIGKEMVPDKFFKIIHESTEPTIKQTLLNQKLISGVGNIYADEALLLAKLHPTLKPKQITADQSAGLLIATRQVLQEGLDDRGTTIDSYLDAFGNPGHHQDNLRVYGRKGEACPQCGTAIEYTEVGGRRTHFCPHCQQLPQLSLF